MTSIGMVAELFSRGAHGESSRCWTKQVGNAVLFYSYATPIAVWVAGKVFVTDERFSVTTARHLAEVRNAAPDHEVKDAVGFAELLDELGVADHERGRGG